MVIVSISKGDLDRGRRQTASALKTGETAADNQDLRFRF
jgi:hypothetical protein